MSGRAGAARRAAPGRNRSRRKATCGCPEVGWTALIAPQASTSQRFSLAVYESRAWPFAFTRSATDLASRAISWDAVALPVHFWIDADGIIRDGALGGIGPDVMAAGLRTILPGVSVTP